MFHCVLVQVHFVNVHKRLQTPSLFTKSQLTLIDRHLIIIDLSPLTFHAMSVDGWLNLDLWHFDQRDNGPVGGREFNLLPLLLDGLGSGTHAKTPYSASYLSIALSKDPPEDPHR